MQNVSKLYQTILAETHWKEIMVKVNGVEFGYNSLSALTTSNSLFSENYPMIGACVAGEVDLSYFPGDNIPARMARIELFVRISNGTNVSEWIPKGVYFTDTRVTDPETGIYTLHGYDAMLKAEQPFLTEGDPGEWPRPAPTVAAQIAEKMGVTMDERTALNSSYMVPYPNDYTCREILSQIAVAHAGNWTISDSGQLRLIQFAEIPAETFLMVDQEGNTIRLGEVGIIV